MTYLDTLRKLAQAATQNRLPQSRYVEVPPERILAMLAVIEAAKALRTHMPHGDYERTPEVTTCDAFDAALAALEGDK